MPGMPLTLTEVSLWHLIPQTHIYQPLQHPEHYLLFPSMATTQYLFSHLPISKHWLCACPVPCTVQVTRKKKRNKVQFLSSKHSLSRSPTTKILSVTKINKWKQCFISKSFSSPDFELNLTLGPLFSFLGSKALLDNIIALWIEEQYLTPWPH